MEKKRTYKSKSGAEYELVQTKPPSKPRKRRNSGTKDPKPTSPAPAASKPRKPSKPPKAASTKRAISRAKKSTSKRKPSPAQTKADEQLSMF